MFHFLREFLACGTELLVLPLHELTLLACMMRHDLLQFAGRISIQVSDGAVEYLDIKERAYTVLDLFVSIGSGEPFNALAIEEEERLKPRGQHSLHYNLWVVRLADLSRLVDKAHCDCAWIDDASRPVVCFLNLHRSLASVLCLALPKNGSNGSLHAFARS